MKISLDLRTSLSQTLTPQQIQYLKLLQLPVLQLEQHVRQEIEQNPILLDYDDTEGDLFEPAPVVQDHPIDEKFDFGGYEEKESFDGNDGAYDGNTEELKQQFNDDDDPFEFHKMLWDSSDDVPGPPSGGQGDNDDDFEPFQIKEHISLSEELLRQLHLMPLSEEELVLCEHIIGNLDDDGYLRTEMIDIVAEANEFIEEYNFRNLYEKSAEKSQPETDHKNPALQYALSEKSAELLRSVVEHNPELQSKVASGLDDHYHSNGTALRKDFVPLGKVDEETGERMLSVIRQLDPPGIGSRTIQECLIAQCKTVIEASPLQRLALEILTDHYEAFTKKHYQQIIKAAEIEEEDLKDALELIRTLNPKPGGGDITSTINTVIPDFVINKDEESGELLVSVNDSRLPTLHISKAYENLKKEAKFKLYNKDTRDWIRNKFEDAKFLIQALRQRKNTMLKVMTAIAGKQSEFCEQGSAGLKPMIYKDISEVTGLDISTVCRIVNGKYVQTDFGTQELKYFFSESLPNDEGEEISTTVIKQILKEVIDKEDKKNPLSDDQLSAMLKEKGYNVARRTVAKYREQMRLPVARLRKEL